ncbi:polysaccharide pyruvyl transferase family protein [Algoriphagus jejuensis]|uniref:polysaccharide pyruvyl transferase family protein n=1 Tax=Algoriphagus jejuensis TaxID=419934 RepID=UPI0031D123C7
MTSSVPLIYYYDYEVNWGDSINKFIFESILERRILSANKTFNIYNRECISGIGSVLGSRLKNYSIWGSGFLSESDSLVYKPVSLLAIRGKLSLAKLESKFGISTDIMGDPALLFKEFYHPNPNKCYQLGIIPHFKELDEKVIVNIKNYYGSDINIISPKLDVFEFADEVLKCERILSSSLHGLVLAESYGIPTARIDISKNVLGGDFKYIDYYSGVGIDYHRVNSHSLLDLLETKSVMSASCDLKELSYSKNELINSLKAKFESF